MNSEASTLYEEFTKLKLGIYLKSIYSKAKLALAIIPRRDSYNSLKRATLLVYKTSVDARKAAKDYREKLREAEPETRYHLRTRGITIANLNEEIDETEKMNITLKKDIKDFLRY